MKTVKDYLEAARDWMDKEGWAESWRTAGKDGITLYGAFLVLTNPDCKYYNPNVSILHGCCRAVLKAAGVAPYPDPEDALMNWYDRTGISHVKYVVEKAIKAQGESHE